MSKKRYIRRTRDGLVGYEGTKRVKDFGKDKEAADSWAKGESTVKMPTGSNVKPAAAAETPKTDKHHPTSEQMKASAERIGAVLSTLFKRETPTTTVTVNVPAGAVVTINVIETE